MASTNLYQHAEGTIPDQEPITGRGLIPVRRGRRKGAADRGSTSRRKTGLAKQRKQAVLDAMVHGWPEWNGLQPVILFLLLPGIMGIAVAITGPWPTELLYSLAGILGLYVFYTAFRGVELILACILLYLPFSTTYVIPVAPGINGTNMLMLLGLFASVLRAVDERQSWLYWPPGTTTVFAFGALSAFSAFTVLRLPGGWEHIRYDELLNYKAWLDQFVLYFIALSCIRSVEVAKRVVVYMCIGIFILVLYSIPEMLDKMGNSTIDKSRIGGPHQQPNMFGGFVSYAILPLAAIFVVYIKDIRVWLLTPYFLVAAKVLLSTFSRGAYLAMAVGAFLTAYYKGKGFLIFWAMLGLCALLLFPSLLPDAINDRLFKSTSQNVTASKEPQLDASSAKRLVLWRAGAQMVVESPILGKGFKGFKKLKSEYVDVEMKESDPHSAYIYIATQMGLPALVLFLLILLYSFHLGRKLSRNREDKFIMAIGIGGSSATVCYAVVNIFGSRAVNLEFTAYFWAMLVCMQVINQQLEGKQSRWKKRDSGGETKRRTNAYEAGESAMDVNNMARDGEDQPSTPPAPLSPMLTRPGQRARKRSRLSMADARERRRRLKPR